MALTNAYITVKELEQHVLANDAATFSERDTANMELAIAAICRWLDDVYDTSFYERTETRYYSAEWNDLLYVDDLLTVTTLKTDSDNNGTYDVTWATTDYWLEPRDAALGSQPKPYTAIRRDSQQGDYYFPTTINYGVEIVGTWGYCTIANIPFYVKQFVVLVAHRIWKQKDYIFGAAGNIAVAENDISTAVGMNKDLMYLLSPLDRGGLHVGGVYG